METKPIESTNRKIHILPSFDYKKDAATLLRLIDTSPFGEDVNTIILDYAGVSFNDEAYRQELQLILREHQPKIQVQWIQGV